LLFLLKFLDHAQEILLFQRSIFHSICWRSLTYIHAQLVKELLNRQSTNGKMLARLFTMKKAGMPHGIPAQPAAKRRI
jgi:hypothetical protein